MTEEQKEKRREYRRAWDAKWYATHREEILAKRRLHRRQNREAILATKRMWNAANKDKCYAYGKKHRKLNKDRILARNAAWAKANRKKINARVNRRKREDLNFNIGVRLRTRLCQTLGKNPIHASAKTVELLGCSITSFRRYIESRFEPGMTWENIHLDHIIPCALFDLTKIEHQKTCFHFSNYQPLFARENQSKGTRLFHKPGYLNL